MPLEQLRNLLAERVGDRLESDPAHVFPAALLRCDVGVVNGSQTGLGQGRRSGYALASQLPIWPERQLLKDGAYQVGRLLEKWSAPGWPDPETEQIYERAQAEQATTSENGASGDGAAAEEEVVDAEVVDEGK